MNSIKIPIKRFTLLGLCLFTLLLVVFISCGTVSGSTADISLENDDNIQLTANFELLNYSIQTGDTIFGIAKQFDVSLGAVIACNDFHDLRAGDELRIPNMNGIAHLVKDGDTLDLISKTYLVPEEVIRAANNISGDTIKEITTLFIPGANVNHAGNSKMLLTPFSIVTIEKQFILPVQSGRITYGFGWQKTLFSDKPIFHRGIDLAGDIGTPVMAAMSGIVRKAGNDHYFGNYVILNHNNGYQTFYVHLSVITVKQGDKVEKRSKIGEVGSTGYSSGPQLHFAVFKNGTDVNPLAFLEKYTNGICYDIIN
jgi:murein DD-endopeptidase MepM/ murein hydrolase activator NlpD